MYKRAIIPPEIKSFFLFGPRQAGKSTFVKSIISAKDLYIDLLPHRLFLEYVKDPGQIREVILAHSKKYSKFTCVIDEIQKVPALLDEVHEIIESNKKIRFIITGSSARKLVRGGANLLAGRAYMYHFFPLTFFEIGNKYFDLEKALTVGTLPSLWQQNEEDAEEDYVQFLKSYSETYLKEEIAAEGVVRKIGPFSQFLDISAVNDGESVNYSNIARECSVSVKTVQQYYQILEDTFIAYKIPAWQKSARKRLVSQPRYYFFDTGVTNALSHSLGSILNPIVKGRRFEQFIITQLIAIINYKRFDYQLYYWRTNHGNEVDLLICQGNTIKCALEIKSSRSIGKQNAKGLKSFLHDYPLVPAYILGINQTTRLLENNITIMDWKEFLSDTLNKL